MVKILVKLLTAVGLYCTLSSPTIAQEKTFDYQHFQQEYQGELTDLKLSSLDIEAIGRTAFAEAANQSVSGLSAVVHVIINRKLSKKFGATITQIVNAPHQFEPVFKVGGWGNLPALTISQKAQIETIVSLTVDGRLPDLTKGALYFQNVSIVADREKRGKVTTGLTNFNGSKPTVKIKDHTFYTKIKKSNSKPKNLVKVEKLTVVNTWDVFAVSAKSINSWDVYSAPK